MNLRQDIPHQGMGYEKENYRIFGYIDFKKVERDQDGTTGLFLRKSRLLSEDILAINGAYNSEKNEFIKK